MALSECLDTVRQGVSLQPPDVVFVRTPQAKVLRRGLAAIVLAALRESDALIKPLLGAKSKKDFAERRTKIFQDYINVSYVIANSFSGAGAEKREVATKGAFECVKEILTTKGTPRLGVDRTREAIFCLDTLRRAFRLVDQVHTRGVSVSEERKEQDRTLSRSFNLHALWAKLHLDCVRLIVTKSSNAGVEPEILDTIMDGARAAVMAYSFVRQGLELRRAEELLLPESGPLDTEDKDLLEESYSDYKESERRLDVQA